MGHKSFLFAFLLCISLQLSPSMVQTPDVSYSAKNAGLIADGKADDSAALNKAISDAIAGNFGTIQLPCGQIMVNKPVNLTNRSNLTLRGCASNLAYGTADAPPSIFSSNMTQLLCNTGSVCIDTTGSSDLLLEKFAIRVAKSYSTPSNVAILLGRDIAREEKSRGQYCYAQFNRIQDLFIFMDSDPTASVRGRIGIYNVGAEHFTISGGKIVADEAVEFADRNILHLESPFQNLATGCPFSMSVIEINGSASFQSWKFFAMEFNNVQTLTADRCHMIAGMPGTTAINVNSGSDNGNIRLACQIEHYQSAININVNIDHLDISGLMVVDPKNPIIGLNANVGISSSRLGTRQVHGTPQPLFNAGSNNIISGSYIDLGTLGGIDSPGIKLIGSTVVAPGHQDREIKFAPGSHYLLLDDTGISAVGGLTSR
jgi:hypothetical protein